MSDQTSEFAKLRQEMAQQRSDFQTMEVALVSRIADVDDDRSHAATRLQRTLQNHRDEIDLRLKRQNAIVTTALILFVIIVSVLLVFVYAKFDQARQTFSEEIAELRQTLEEVKTTVSTPRAEALKQDPATREKLAQLSSAVNTITDSLERLAKEQELLQAVEPEPQPADLQIDPRVEPQQVADPAPPEVQTSESPAPSSTQVEQAGGDEEATEQTTVPLPATPTPDSQPEDSRAEDSGTETPEVAQTTEAETASIPPSEPPESAPEPTAPPEPEPLQEQPTTAEVPESPQTPAPTPEPPPAEPVAPETDASPAEQETGSAVTEPERIPVGDTPYSVQLMGFFSLDSLQTFAKRYDLKDWLVYDKETYQGRPWYVLVESLHPTRESAEAAVAALPSDMAKFDIWIRKLDPDDRLYRTRSAGD